MANSSLPNSACNCCQLPPNSSVGLYYEKRWGKAQSCFTEINPSAVFGLTMESDALFSGYKTTWDYFNSRSGTDDYAGPPWAVWWYKYGVSTEENKGYFQSYIPDKLASWSWDNPYDVGCPCSRIEGTYTYTTFTPVSQRAFWCGRDVDANPQGTSFCGGNSTNTSAPIIRDTESTTITQFTISDQLCPQNPWAGSGTFKTITKVIEQCTCYNLFALFAGPNARIQGKAGTYTTETEQAIFAPATSGPEAKTEFYGQFSLDDIITAANEEKNSSPYPTFDFTNNIYTLWQNFSVSKLAYIDNPNGSNINVGYGTSEDVRFKIFIRPGHISTCYIKVWLKKITTNKTYNRALNKWEDTNSTEIIETHEKKLPETENKKCFKKECINVIEPIDYFSCDTFLQSNDEWIFVEPQQNQTITYLIHKFSFVKDYEPNDPHPETGDQGCKPNGYPAICPQ